MCQSYVFSDNSYVDQEYEQSFSDHLTEQRKVLASLNPEQTALFFGVTQRFSCRNSERREWAAYSQMKLLQLLDTGFNTILVNDSTLFGFYALYDFLALRETRSFALYRIDCAFDRNYWITTDNFRLNEMRLNKHLHMTIECDDFFTGITISDWYDLLFRRVGIAITDVPRTYVNRKYLSERKIQQWSNARDLPSYALPT